MAAKNLELIGECFLAPGYSSEYMYFYLATQLSESPLPQDVGEYLSVKKIGYSELLKTAREGGIKDAKTLAALFLLGDREISSLYKPKG